MPEHDQPTTDDPYYNWLQIGVTLGYCSEIYCDMHDVGPYSKEEEALLEEGQDPCRYVVRLYGPNGPPTDN